MSEQMKDRQILRFVSETPWAILPSALVQIQQVVAFHAAGGRMSREEIAAALEAAARPRSNGTPPGGSIAVLPLWGSIVPHAGLMSEMSGATALDSWLEQFRQAAADQSVGTVVLNIDSPGGSVELVAETAAAIRDARKSVNVVAVANTMAASAAYWLGAQADEFYVSPSGLVGSIGVYAAHEDISGALAQEGIDVTLISAPADGFKVEGNPYEPLSDEALAARQASVDAFYRMFVDDVAKGRGVSAAEVEASYGRGRVLTAKDALAAGMVDGVASLDEVLGRLAKGRQANGARPLAAAPIAAGFHLNAPTGEAMLVGEFVPNIATFDTDLNVTSTTGGFDISATTELQPSSTARETSETRKETQMEPVINDDRPLTRDDHIAEQERIKERQDELNEGAAGRLFNDDERAEYDRLEDRWHLLEATVKELEERDASRRAKIGEQVARSPKSAFGGDKGNGRAFNTNADRRGPDNVFDLAAYRRIASSLEDQALLWADGAKRANELAQYVTDHKDETRAFVERVIESSKKELKSNHSMGFRVLMTADPAYDDAFGAWIMGRARGKQMDHIQAAITEAGLSSETPVPVTIDPTVLFSGDGSRDPLRSLARVVTITGLTWRGLSSDGTVMTYGAEASAFSPDTPSYDAPDVSVEKAKGEIQFTVEVDTDWPSLREELQMELAQAKRDLEAVKFMHGTGSDEPTGLLFALDDDGSSLVKTAAHDTITLDDIANVSDELPANFDFNASWLAHKKFYSLVRKLAREDGTSEPWTDIGPGFQAQNALAKGLLMGSPAYTHSEISSLVGQADEEVAIIGDFARGFVIVDRVGLNVEFDPHPRDGNGAWLGQRALLAWFRNNTALRTPNAFRVLQVKGS